jgi:hypothetical protein
MGRKRKRHEMSDANSCVLKTTPSSEADDSDPNTLPSEIPDKLDDLNVGNLKNYDNSDEEEIEMTPRKDDSATLSKSSPSPSLRRSRPDLFFLGIVVKVNGYTDPDNVSIKRMLQKHGGDFETYETERVTHIIAEHLSTAKAEMYKRQRKPRPVCTPAWLVDSVREGKLLPHGKYLLQELRDRSPQVGIRALFAPRPKESVKPKSIMKANVRMPHAEDGTIVTESEESMVQVSKFCDSKVAPLTQEDTTSCTSALSQQIKTRPNDRNMETAVQGENTPREVDGECDKMPATSFYTSPGHNTEHSKRSESATNTACLPGTPALKSGTDNSNYQNLRTPPKSITGKKDDKYINGKIRTVGTSCSVMLFAAYSLYSHFLFSIFDRDGSQLSRLLLQKLSIEFHRKLQAADNNSGEPVERCCRAKFEGCQAFGVSCGHGLLLCRGGPPQFSPI